MENTSKTKQQSVFIKNILKTGNAMNIPMYGTFELTGRCNFDCKMCYVHVMDQEDAVKRELSTDQWKRIFDQAYENGLVIALLTGGECLLRKDFKELYLHLWNKGVTVSVNTNGFLIDDDYINFFKQYPPKKIQITLYGSNDLEYEAITGRKAFDRVFSTLNKLKNNGINFSVAITPCKQSLHFCKNIMKLAYENDFPFTLNELMLPPRENIQRNDYYITVEELVDLACERARLRGKVLEPCARESLPVPGESTSGGTKTKKRCYAGGCRYSVNWEGRLTACVGMDSLSVSVEDKGFAAAWKEVSENMKTVTLPAKCNNCDYNSICSPCHIARHVQIHKDECNPLQCELMVQKCMRGLCKLKEK